MEQNRKPYVYENIEIYEDGGYLLNAIFQNLFEAMLCDSVLSRRMASSGMLRRVALVRTDVSE
jgi:hypothetical protein